MIRNQDINIEDNERNNTDQELMSAKLQDIQLQQLIPKDKSLLIELGSAANKKCFHNLEYNDLKLVLATDFDKGLTYAQVEQRLKIYGKNLITQQPRTFFQRILESHLNFHSISFSFCGIALFIVYGLNKNDTQHIYMGFFIILFVFMINLLVAIYQERREQFINSTKNSVIKNYTVIRDNKQQQIDQRDLVVGDIIQIKSGQKIPADIRILESFGLEVIEANLTGETEQIYKINLNSENTSYYEAKNILFGQTHCTHGQGKGVIVSTGDYSVMGTILKFQHDNYNTYSSIVIYNYLKKSQIFSVCLGILFFLFSYFLLKVNVYQSIAMAIAIYVSNVPISLLVNNKLSSYLSTKNLMKKNILLQNEKQLYTIGDISRIVTERTGVLNDQNFSVTHIYYNGNIYKNKNIKSLINCQEFDENSKEFQTLWLAALVCNNGKFDLSGLDDKSKVNYQVCPILKGDFQVDQTLLRFLQQIQDVESIREKINIAKQINGSNALIYYTGNFKQSAIILEEESSNSHFTIYIKGVPEKVLEQCTHILLNGETVVIDQQLKFKLKETIDILSNCGQKIQAFSKQILPKDMFPRGYNFKNLTSFYKIPFNYHKQTFCGLFTFMEQPKDQVSDTISLLNSLNIKTVMATETHLLPSTFIAKQINILPQNLLTNEEQVSLNEINQNWLQITIQSESVVINGNYLDKFNCDLYEKKQKGNIYEEGNYSLLELIKKPYLIFTRISNQEKKLVVNAFQANNEIVAGIGFYSNDIQLIRSSDVSISMSDAKVDILPEESDIVILDNNFNSIIDIIEEGRNVQDQLLRAYSYILSSHMTEIISFAAFIILQIPLPLSYFQYIVISFITDTFSVFSQSFEEPNIDTIIRIQPNKKQIANPFKVVLFSFFQTGFIQFCSGIIGYYTTFNYYGFPINTLFGLAKIQGYKPAFDDFANHLNPQTNQLDPYFNQDLYNLQPNCVEINESANKLKYDIDWFDRNQAHYDLRKAFLKCDLLLQKWVSNQNWSYCDISSESNKSPITNQTICYSTEALFYAQSSFFVCFMFFQWVKLIINNTRIQSFITNPLNQTKVISILIMFLVCIILLYVPGVQDVFGGRPIDFWLFGMPSFIFCIFYTIYEETKKFLIRNNRWFYKYSQQ